MFQEALAVAEVTQTSQKAWSTTYINLGTCYRKLKYVFTDIWLSGVELMYLGV